MLRGDVFIFPPDTFISCAIHRLVLMTYYGIILLMTGYQADEEHIVRQYKGIVNQCVIPVFVYSFVLSFRTYSRVSARYPKGTLWILNKVKIQCSIHAHR